MDTDPHDPLAATIARRGVAILDGGLATALAARGADLSGGLWSARVLRERPELVREVHADFLRAGADVVITASYQVSVDGCRAAGIAQAEAEQLVRASVGLAREAREVAGRPDALVAASIGPYGAALADGSEYHGDYGTTVSELQRFHRWRLELLTSEQPDLLAIETLPSAAELEALLELLEDQPGPPAWITFACRDGGHIADGTPFAHVATRAATSARVLGVGINCTPPRYVAELLASLGPAPRATHLIVYPNLGDSWDPERGRWVRRQQASDLPRWRRLGVDVIGGCCGTTPEDIRELAARLG